MDNAQLWGGEGPGVPTLRDLLLSRPRRALGYAASGQWRTAWSVVTAAAANVATFHTRRPLKARCPCCTWGGPGFVATAHDTGTVYNSACPACSARSRHRGLAGLLPIVIDAIGARRALVFAPEHAVMTVLEHKPKVGTVDTIDLFMEGVTFPGQDIQQLTIDGTWDLVVCNHVLEHVPDDAAAIAELARVTGGAAVVTVPGRFDRDTVVFDGPDGNGHLRDYGQDLAVMLRASFEHVIVVQLATAAPKLSLMRTGEPAFLCCHTRSVYHDLLEALVERNAATGWPRRTDRSDRLVEDDLVRTVGGTLGERVDAADDGPAGRGRTPTRAS
jgi:SAM-dependent methyltransferase